MDMKILYTAFNGKNNSSKILLDNIKTDECDKLYLKNSFLTSVKQLENKLKNNNYELIIAFGQAKLSKNTIKLETLAKLGEDSYKTDYNYCELIKKLNDEEFNIILSDDAGNYLCNNIYYHGLKYIKDNHKNINMIFLHIPKINEIEDINKLADTFKI